jgi:potassium efflux system protein
MRENIISACFIVLFGLFYITAFAQSTGDTIKNKNSDSVNIGYVARMQAFAKKSAKESAEDLNADKALMAQNKTFEDIKLTIQKAGMYMQNGPDTTVSTKQLSEIALNFMVAGDGVLINQGSAQTFRNLTATSKIIDELLNKANAIKTRLDLYHNNLVSYRYQLDSLISKPELFKFSNDSSTLSKYLKHLVVIAYQVQPTDSALKKMSDNVQSQLNNTNLLILKLQTSLQQINEFKAKMANNTFQRDFGNIWVKREYSRPFGEILAQAKAKGWLNVLFYFQNNTFVFVFLIVLVFVAFIYLRSLKGIYADGNLLNEKYNDQLVLRSPLLSALVIAVNLFQFIFFSPPFALTAIFAALSACCLSILFRGFITRYWMKVWLISVVLFVLAAADNLILQASREERWFMLILSVIDLLFGMSVTATNRKSELREKWIVYAIGFMAILEGISIIANIFGRYNLAKTLLISGYLNVVVAILFLWTVRLVNEGLFLAFNVYVQQDRKLFYLNLDKVGKRAPTSFYILLVLGWIILFGRNFAWFDYIAVPTRNFFAAERVIGDYTFTINRLLLFIAILAISVIISKIVSFFASDNHLVATNDDKGGKKGVGSWLLIIRIVILSLGFFLAIAAGGIPVDRITIVIGALGVGIGFGLQTLVNNLVSGLIIAFEKPVNVGDIVEIDGQSGTMKSIGFRSSVITTWDGADVVMPNGDLLNSHLTNWTLGGNRKRTSLVVGISYSSDLTKARDLITEIIHNDDRISKSNIPLVHFEQFNNSAIDVKLYFWARKMKDSLAIRSDLILKIKTVFASNGIDIPFPQQDIYLHHPLPQQEKDTTK